MPDPTILRAVRQRFVNWSLLEKLWRISCVINEYVFPYFEPVPIEIRPSAMPTCSPIGTALRSRFVGSQLYRSRRAF